MQKKQKKQKKQFSFFNKIKQILLIFIYSLFFIDRKNKANVFFLQSIIGLFNFALSITFILSFFIFKKDLSLYNLLYIFYGFFLLFYILLSSYFYYYFRHAFINKEKFIFWISIFLAPIGLNLFISIFFYFKLGFNTKQNQLNKQMLNENNLKARSNNLFFVIEKSNKFNFFSLQSFIALFNLILSSFIVIIFTLFKNTSTFAICIYVSFGFFLLLYILFSLYFYHHYLKHILNYKQRKYFLFALFLAPIGFNLFISIYFYFKLSVVNINRKKQLITSKSKLANSKLYYKDKKNIKNIFILQINITFFNLISFLGLVTIYIIFKNNLAYYIPIIIYILSGFFLLFYVFSSLYFYLFYLKYIFNLKEKLIFGISIFLAPYGINFFILIYLYFKLHFLNKKIQNKEMNILMSKESQTSFINSLFLINRTNKANVFILQSIIGLCNLILFICLLIMLVIFKNNLFTYKMLIIYLLYGFYIILNILFSLFFYFSLTLLLNKKEKKYFLSSIFWSMFGINLFTSIYFYLKSGISAQQKARALWIINKNRINEIIQIDDVKNNLNKNDLSKIKTLLTIVKNNHESKDNINEYILKLLLSKNIKWNIKIDDKEIIELGKNL